ncbi:MAG: hypothetical protein ACRDJE_03590 [Dehalococcoidia bacterium]
MMDPDTPQQDGDARTPEREAEARALLAVVHGLRALAQGRLSGLAIAPGEYLADIYCIQRVTTLLAMELSALGRSLRRTEARAAAEEVHAIERALAAALDQRGIALEDCVLDLAEARVTRRDGDAV